MKISRKFKLNSQERAYQNIKEYLTKHNWKIYLDRDRHIKATKLMEERKYSGPDSKFTWLIDIKFKDATLEVTLEIPLFIEWEYTQKFIEKKIQEFYLMAASKTR